MPDYTIPTCVTLVLGQGSSGKTTFGFRYLLNSPFAARFIFDDRGQASLRLGVKHCGTAAECEAALATRWVCFNPHVMFPGHRDGCRKPLTCDCPTMARGFSWFCNFAFNSSKRGKGRKVFYIDECWQHMDSRFIPPEFENIVRTGRTEDLETFCTTHRPRDIHTVVRQFATEIVGFDLREPAELDAIEPYWPNVYKIKGLPKYHYIAVNRESGAELAGCT